jgi:hypothetical protein
LETKEYKTPVNSTNNVGLAHLPYTIFKAFANSWVIATQASLDERFTRNLQLVD